MKTILISGAAGGIGTATARVFVREGWQVYGVDTSAPEDSNLFEEFYEVDLTDNMQISTMFEDLANRVSGLGSVVNNAALQLCQPLLETTVDEWDALMAVNLRAVFLMMKHAHPLLKKCAGSVVNVGSVHARATSANLSAYAASKGGLESLTRAVALEFAADGIRVNGVHPGAVETEMLKAGLGRGHLTATTVTAALDKLGQKHPLARIGRPEEIAEAILFLADGQKSSFVTGSFLTVDGGALSHLSTE